MSEALIRFCVGCVLLIGGILFNICETWYFGWNLTAQSKAEMICDYISKLAIWCGILILLYVQIFMRGETL